MNMITGNHYVDPCRRYKVRYPTGFNTATSSGGSVQITSNSLHTCTYVGHVAVELWLIGFYFIRYGDTDVQSLSTFPARFVLKISS